MTPANPQAEEQVLGALLRKPALYADISNILKPEDFSRKSYEVVYAAIADLSQRGTRVDLITVTQALRDAGCLDLAGGSVAIAELTDTVASTAHVTEHADIVAGYSRERRLKRLGEAIVRDIESGAHYQDVIKRVQDFDTKQVQPTKSIQFVHFADTIEDAKKNMAAPGEVKGLLTGWPSIDKMFRGMQGGQLIVVYGPTKHRKSTFVRNIVKKVSQDGAPVLYVGLEEVGAQNTERFLDMGADNLPIIYPPADNPTPSPEDIDGLVAAAVEEGIQLVVVDHLHMWQAKGESDASGITKICQEMKRVAMKYNVPLILISHISGDRTQVGAPGVERLKGSTSIAQLADKVICVYSRGLDFADTPDTEIEIHMKLSRVFVPEEHKFAKLSILKGAELAEPATFAAHFPGARP